MDQQEKIKETKNEKTYDAYLRGGATGVILSQKGFTLAEVLITLAIIGVVAVLTVPTLIAQNQQRGWNTADSVFQGKLGEALKVMNTQGILAGYRDTRSFVNELSKYLKIVKVCDNTDLTPCFEDKVYWGGGEAEPKEVDISVIKTAKHFGLEDKWPVITDVVGFQLNNGTNGLIAYNPDCKQDPYSNQIVNVTGSTNGKRGSVALGTNCVAVLYDTSGFSKPNTQGKDLRAINVEKLGKECAFEVGGTCYGKAFNPKPLTKAECNAQKDALGIKTCSDAEDYWAGAVSECGGVNKIATAKQLDEISKYIYNTDHMSPSGPTYNLVRDNEKAIALGFIFGLYEYNPERSYVWVNRENSPGMADVYVLESNWAGIIGTSLRRSGIEQAVCIVD